MQFKVPQDVQRPDTIVGPLTFVQLIICLVGFAIAYGVYAILSQQGLPAPIWFIPVFIIVLLTLAFAFLKIANLSFHRYLALIIERFITPNKRVWVKGADRVIEPATSKKEEEKTPEKSKEAKALEQKEQQFQELSNITAMVDTSDKKEEAKLKEIDNTKDEELLQKAFTGESKTKKEESPKEKILELSKNPSEEKEKSEPKKKRRRRRRRKKKSEAVQTTQSAPTQTAQQVSSETKPQEKVHQHREEQKTDVTANTSQSTTEASEKPKKKRRRRRRKRKNPEQAAQNAQNTPSKELEKHPSQPSPTDKQTPPAPSWMNTEQETPPTPIDQTQTKPEAPQTETPPARPQTAPDTAKSAPVQQAAEPGETSPNVSTENKTVPITAPSSNQAQVPPDSKPVKKAQQNQEFSKEDLEKGQEITFE